MENGKLFLSFWDICLDNLPEGTLRHRRISPEEAKSSIERARQEHRLLCVSGDDLLAPFRKRERKNHRALCRVLTEHYGIRVSEEDFLSGYESGPEPLYSITPLNCVQVLDQNRLLVITCCYIPGEKKPGDPPVFDIEPMTVEFHLIESA